MERNPFLAKNQTISDLAEYMFACDVRIIGSNSNRILVESLYFVLHSANNSDLTMIKTTFLLNY